jgi:RNA polymerase sigma factor (sigma-70 family)
MDERPLITGLRNRDPVIVEHLLDTYGDRLLRTAYFLCGDKTEAEDLVQATLLEAFRSIHRFSGRSSVYTWLHAILLNLSRHYHRKRKRLVCDDELARQELVQPTQCDVGADVNFAATAINTALKQLSLSHREVLTLRFYSNLPIGEIAQTLGISQGTVKSRLHYAIAEMRKLLPDELNLFGDGGTKERNQ